MKKQLLISLLIIILLFVGTVAVVMYGKGYRFGFDNGKLDIKGTGLLVATSDPDGASVFINDHLTTATDNTINLSPGTYDVRIFKEGYFPWEKKITVEEEVVSKAEALLFPTAPKLDSITNIGILHPTIDPTQTKIAYTVSSQSARKNGIYILDMTQRPLITLQAASTQIVDDTLDIFSEGQLLWSPDGRQILATVPNPSRGETAYLLNTNGFNELPQDATATLTSLMAVWDEEKNVAQEARLQALKQPIRKLINENFNVLSYSPDETKILYIASRSSQLPLIIKPRHLGVALLSEERNIEEGKIYVYDIKDDVNYYLEIGNWKLEIGNSQGFKPLGWFPDSKHLIHVNDKKINIMELDGSNNITIYAGPFVDNYVFPWPNGSKIVILTNLGNQEIPENLYTIGLK